MKGGRTTRRCLTFLEVCRASRVWLINSVREWVGYGRDPGRGGHRFRSSAWSCKGLSPELGRLRSLAAADGT